MCNCITITGPAEILTEPQEICRYSAGRKYGEEMAPLPGAIARMCCVVVGDPTPVVTWTRIVVDSTGIAREVPVDVTDPDITIQ